LSPSVNQSFSLIVACEGWRPDPALAIECGRSSIAFDIHLKDRRVMDEAIDGGQRHSLIWKYLSPLAEWLVSGDQH
jgi:hypothetical protein